jgi:hypothetical protein
LSVGENGPGAIVEGLWGFFKEFAGRASAEYRLVIKLDSRNAPDAADDQPVFGTRSTGKLLEEPPQTLYDCLPVERVPNTGWSSAASGAFRESSLMVRNPLPQG